MLVHSRCYATGQLLKCMSRNVSTSSRTVDPVEIATFERLSHEWMDEEGHFKPLHSYNRLRVPWIVNGMGRDTAPKSLEGLKIVDVGCGGGLLSIPLARLGAQVDGIDLSHQALRVAEYSCQKTLKDIGKNLKFHNSTVEDFSLTNQGKYDAVVASEIIEHVSDLSTFLDGCVRLCKRGAPLFFTTINKTITSRIFAIWLAENVLGIVPPGVHDWEKLVEPEKLQRGLEERNCRVSKPLGVLYNPATNRWSWSSFDLVNYAVIAKRS